MPDPVDPAAPPPPPCLAPRDGASRYHRPAIERRGRAGLFSAHRRHHFYLLEKRDGFVRFYAMQSIIFGAVWLLFGIAWRIVYSILAGIPAIGWVFAVLLWLTWAAVNIIFLVVLIVAIMKAFSGVRWDIPWVGPTARKQVDGTL